MYERFLTHEVIYDCNANDYVDFYCLRHDTKNVNVGLAHNPITLYQEKI